MTIAINLSLVRYAFIGFVLTCHPLLANESDNRFIEFQGPNDTTVSYDLATVEMIQLGRFTIVQITMDEPDAIKFKLKSLDMLMEYCSKPLGRYAVSKNVFILGSPDIPVREIEIKQSEFKEKVALWAYPYRRFAFSDDTPELVNLSCGNTTEYTEIRNQIINGIRAKYLYDCKRGIDGMFLNQDHDDFTKVSTGFVRRGTYDAEYYEGVCRAVMKQSPYLPP